MGDEATYLEGWADLNARIRRGEPWSGLERNAAFLSLRSKEGALGMADVAPLLGLDDLGDGRAAVRLDVDFDGDDDLVLTQRTAPRLRVMRGSVADGTLNLAVQLEGTASHREAIGAVVYATLEGADGGQDPVVHARTRSAGSGYLAQSSSWLRFHFGRAGERRRAPRVRLQVRWPGRTVSELEDFGTVRAGRSYTLREGSATPEERARPEPVALAAKAIAPVDPDEPLRVALPAFTSCASLRVRDGEGQERRIFGLTPAGPRGIGRPAVALVIDSGDVEALAKLGDLAQLAADCREADVPAVVLDLAAARRPDAPSTKAFGETWLAAHGWSGEVLEGVADASIILEEFFAWRIGQEEPPPLPWSIVFDPDGRIAHLKTAGWGEGDLARDLAVLAIEPVGRAAAAAPFGGRWIDRPTVVDLAPLQTRLTARGADAASRELGLARVTTRRLDPVDVALRLGLAQLRSQQFAEAEASFAKAAEADPESLRAHQGRGIALQSLGRTADSRDAWARALELAPDDRTSLTNHALTSIELGDLEAGKAAVEQLEAQGAPAASAVQAVRSALERAEAAGGAEDGGRDPQ